MAFFSCKCVQLVRTFPMEIEAELGRIWEVSFVRTCFKKKFEHFSSSCDILRYHFGANDLNLAGNLLKSIDASKSNNGQWFRQVGSKACYSL